MFIDTLLFILYIYQQKMQSNINKMYNNKLILFAKGDKIKKDVYMEKL